MTRSFTLIALGCLCACADPTGPAREGEPVQTDATVYFARHMGGSGDDSQYGFMLVSRFLNAQADTVFLARCYPDTPYPIYGVHSVDTPHSKGAAYSPFWACVGGSDPIVVPPGATRTDTLQVRGPNSWDQSGEPLGVLEGVFQIGFVARYCRAETGCDAPPAEVRSNGFRVVRD